jgi:predicted metal-dependent phosphoesterase TrpH
VNRTPTARSLTTPADTPRWFAGALHLHTNHSDGAIAPPALAALARDAGLDFIAITDHNTTTWTRETMPDAPLAIVGEEITTPAGHANVWGLNADAWIDFRVVPTDRNAARDVNHLVAAAHHAGALFSLNHPYGDCAGCAWQQVIPDGLDAIEIWNGEAGPQDQAIALWDRLLRAGRHVTAVGASDWHRTPAPIGAAAVRVLADTLSAPALIDAIRDGHVIVMRDATTRPPTVTAGCGSHAAAIGGTLRCAAGDSISVRVARPAVAGATATLVVNGSPAASKHLRGKTTTITTPAATGYLRVHVRDAAGATVAITNPIYVQTQ